MKKTNQKATKQPSGKKPKKKAVHPEFKTFCTLTDNFLNEARFKGCFCYHITTNFITEETSITDENIEFAKIISLIINLKGIAFYTIAAEYNENKKLHIHIFLAVKSLIGNNSRITLNLQKVFLINNFIDTRIDECKTFLTTSRQFRYVLGELFVDKKTKKIRTRKKIMHTFIICDSWHEIGKILINFFVDKNLKIRHQCLKDDVLVSNRLIELYENVRDLSLNNIIQLFRLYFEEKNWYVSEFNLYKAVKGTQLSVKPIMEIGKIENLYEDIKEWAIKRHALTFQGFEFELLKNRFLKPFIEHFIKYPATVGQVIELSYNLMEFTDGIYIISTDTFIYTTNALVDTSIKTQNILEFFAKKKIKTVNYYDKTYRYIKQPAAWMKAISERIGDINQINAFYMDFAKFFNRDIAKSIKKGGLTTIIEGVTNSWKTTLTVALLIEFYSINRIAIMVKSEIFSLEDYITGTKEIAICNDFFLAKKKIPDYLEVWSGDAATKVDKKFGQPKDIPRIPSLLLSMDFERDVEKGTPREQEAIWSRVKYFYFKFILVPDDELDEIALSISKELPNIVIFLNKLALKNNKKNIRTVWNTFKSKKK